MRRVFRRTTILCITTLAWLVSLVLAGCSFGPQPMPTPKNLEDELTAIYKTEMAPPPGFENGVQFTRIDANLEKLPSWRYKVTLAFDGVFAGTQDNASGQLEAEIFGNEQSSERRVLLSASGAAFGLSEDRKIEGVRIRNDYYQVDTNKVCSRIESPGPGQIADLSAATLIGGVKNAVPAAQRRTENEIMIWQYSIPPDEVVPPSLTMSEGGNITIAAGDLWVAPSLRAVWQYTITLNVENVILQGDRPLTGQVRATYQLIETSVPYNISIPFGC